MATTPTITCGIDIGSGSTKIVLGPSHGCEIVRNEVGGHTTPTAISFSQLGRQIGATASLKTGIIHLNRLIDGEMDENDTFVKFYKFSHDDEGVTVDDNGSSRIFQPAAVLAMLLGKIKSNVLATIERVTGKPADPATISYNLSVGPGTSEAAQKQLLDAAYGAGMTTATIVETGHCYGQTLERKFPEHMDGRKVMVIDMGHSQTSISILQLGDGSESSDGEEGPKVQLLKSVRNKSFGAGSVDVRLWHHFQSTIPALGEVKEKSRSGQRLLDGCKKLKHLLSQLPDGKVTVENVGQNDTDIKLEVSRAILTELCKSDMDVFSALIKEALGGVTIDTVEVSGGGCRIPMVTSTIREALPEDTMLSHGLDDTSIALGAALVDENCGDMVSMRAEETDERKQLMEAEQEMASRDQDMQLKADTLNKIESHVLEMRSAKHSKHGSLLPTSDLDTHLDELDNWVFSEEADQASKDDVIAKLEAAEQKTKDLCKEYFEALAKETAEKEREMEEEAKKAEIERMGQADEDEEDHDNRRLPKKRRMEIVMKNKSEANELFGGGNYKFAAARYTKALSHCAKFVDLGPEDDEEVNALKLSLNLNLSLSYLKLEKPDQALRVANDAVAIDSQSTKALYRRASIYYEKKNWEKASADVKKAAELAPEDKAIKKLLSRVEAQQKRQKAQEKKMAKKMAAGMFG